MNIDNNLKEAKENYNNATNNRVNLVKEIEKLDNKLEEIEQ